MRVLIALFTMAALLTTAHAGNLHSRAGASATVSSRYVSEFQGLIDDLEASGAVIKFMGGIRGGRCGQSSKHPCGMALDVCQLRRGVVDGRCHIPERNAVSVMAHRHNLFSGGDWCNSDYGHFEAGGSAACGHSWASNGGIYEKRTSNRVSVRFRRANSSVGSAAPDSYRTEYH